VPLSNQLTATTLSDFGTIKRAYKVAWFPPTYKRGKNKREKSYPPSNTEKRTKSEKCPTLAYEKNTIIINF